MPNRLAHETSPYLLQHQHNPVDWYPWGPEALARAKAEEKPILLSVGYSACHWCHVMERESFESEAVAAEMNAGFVCIKVDREERPDIDEIYMRAVQAFTGGHGGWPMTVFLTPDGAPYFGGTYFPPEPRQGMPSFSQVLAHAQGAWADRKDDVERVTSELVEYLDQSGRMPGPEDELTGAWLERVVAAADRDFDAKNGGFRGAPKFPPHGTLAILLAAHHRTGHPKTLEMATATLDAMIKGGMYDLLGGGFARYSVDGEWRVPHFEKMLYDNAQLLPLYADAFKLTGRPWYRRVVVETAEYVLREMTHPEGGFCASQDADSEGVEGKFFAWTPRELRTVLGIVDGTRVATLLQVTDSGTFEHGTSVLRLENPLETLAEDDRALLERALPALFEARRLRVAPDRDDKVLTAWNALMVSALARAGAALSEPRYVEAAARAGDFLLSELFVGGRLQRTWKDGRAHLLGYLDDHSFLVDALIDLWEATFEVRWLEDAVRLADVMLDLFWDGDEGGFFYTGRDAEALVTRSKHMLGGAEPSGNGVAARAFLRLSTLCGRDDLRQRAIDILRRYQPLLDKAPRGLGAEALAGAWATGPVREIAVVGAPADALLAEVRGRYLPFSVLAHVEGEPDLALLPWLEGKSSPEGTATAFVCEGWACQAPVRDPAELAAQLQPKHAPPPKRRASTRLHAPDLPADPALWLNTARPLTIEALRGNVVVLDFWTYCCINCMHVLPELAAIEERFAGRPVVVVGVHSAKFPAEKDRENVQRAIERHRVRHPVVLDSEHAVWQQYTVRSWPTVAVLDPEGRIAWMEPGEANREVLGRVIDDLLAQGEADGSLGEPAWQAFDAEASTTPLRHPGKVHVYPAAAAQTVGADPFGAESRLYVADTGHHRIHECTLALGDDGWPVARLLRTFGDGQPGLVDGSSPRFHAPQGVARAGETLWVADTENHALRAIDLTTGAVRTVAGTGELGLGDAIDPALPLEGALRSPWDVAAVGTDGNPPAPGLPGEAEVVLVAMAGSHQIWLYLPAQDTFGPFVGSGREDHIDGDPTEAALAQPSGLEPYGRFLFFADSETSSVRAFDLAERSVGTFVGAGLFDFGDIDGAGAEVRLQHPLGVTIAEGVLYVADTFNHKIKSISLDGGRTTTLAGGDPAELCEPGGIAAAGDFVIVADTNNHRIRAMRRSTGELRDVEIGELS